MKEPDAVIEAPWTPEQVENLRLWQAAPHVHSFTCGPCRDADTAAGEFPDEHPLTPTVDGWVCTGCAYTQSFAYDYMLNRPPPPSPFEKLFGTPE